MNDIELTKDIVDAIVALILEYKQPEKILIFGSRESNNARRTSDIDVAIFGKTRNDSDINLIKHKLDECVKTPLKFDVLNFYHIERSTLRENILKKGKVIYDAGKN